MAFRDWAAECTSYPNEVCEMVLAHSIGDKVETAYRRGDLFEKRRLLMLDWAKYCDKPKGDVVPLARKRAAEGALPAGTIAEAWRTSH